MTEIKFSFHSKWNDEKSIAERISRIIYSGNVKCFPNQEKSTKEVTCWQIGDSNDWFLRIDLKEKVAYLKYRYGTDEFMNSLVVVLNYIFS